MDSVDALSAAMAVLSDLSVRKWRVQRRERDTRNQRSLAPAQFICHDNTQMAAILIIILILLFSHLGGITVTGTSIEIAQG